MVGNHDVITIKNTVDIVITNFHAFCIGGIYGSFRLVTGFVLNVFTVCSNSGLGSSSSSVYWRSHSQAITACLLFQSSRNVVATNLYNEYYYYIININIDIKVLNITTLLSN